ncbi:MAG: hypothetical protein ACREMG_09930 [Gemmatimonadales bacterium]
MRHRSSWLTFLASSVACAGLVLGTAVPAALAKKPDPPNNTQLPNGRPFQLIQQMIDALDARIDALEAAAPQPGTMWINPLDFIGTTVDLTAAPAATPGLVVTAAGVAADTLQAGLQIPLGFGVSYVTVCYVGGAGGGFVNSLAITQNDVVTPFSSAAVAIAVLAAPGAGVQSCVQTTALVPPADPATGGPLYVAIGVRFSGADMLIIRGIGVQLTPLP